MGVAMDMVKAESVQSLGRELEGVLAGKGQENDYESDVKKTIEELRGILPKEWAERGASRAQVVTIDDPFVALTSELSRRKDENAGHIGEDPSWTTDGKAYFCQLVSQTIARINASRISSLEPSMRRLEVAFGFQDSSQNGVGAKAPEAPPASGSGAPDDYVWYGGEWAPAAVSRLPPLDLNELVEIHTDDLEAVMSLLEDLIKEAFGLGDVVREISDLLVSGLSALVGPVAVKMLAASPPLVFALGFVALVFFHRLQSRKEGQVAPLGVRCIVERADRLSEYSGHVSVSMIDQTYDTHPTRMYGCTGYAVCDATNDEHAVGCPFMLRAFQDGTLLCRLANPSHLLGAEDRTMKIVRAMSEAVIAGRYHRKIESDAHDYYRAWR